VPEYASAGWTELRISASTQWLLILTKSWQHTPSMGSLLVSFVSTNSGRHVGPSYTSTENQNPNKGRQTSTQQHSRSQRTENMLVNARLAKQSSSAKQLTAAEGVRQKLASEQKTNLISTLGNACKSAQTCAS